MADTGFVVGGESDVGGDQLVGGLEVEEGEAAGVHRRAPQPSFRGSYTMPPDFDPADFNFEFATTAIPVLFSTVDDASGVEPYRGILIEDLALTTRSADPIHRVQEANTAVVKLANADGRVRQSFANDLRGVALHLDYVDAEDGYVSAVFDGQISLPTLGDVVTITAKDLKPSVLEDTIPKGTITELLFPGSKDTPDFGAVLLSQFGTQTDMPLRCILDDRDDDIFLYLAPRAIGDGALTFNALKRDGVGGEQFALIHPEEYEILTAAAASALAGVTYPAWATFVHFFTRQFRHGSDELHRLYADISTPAADRNPSRVRRLVLSSTWGLTQPVNAASFDAAEAICTTLGLLVDGVLGLDGSVSAGDVLRELSKTADQWFTFNAAGEWCENVDVYTPAVQLVLGGDAGDNMADIGDLVPRAADDMKRNVVYHYRRDAAGKYPLTVTRTIAAPTTLGATHGSDLEENLLYVSDGATAGKMAGRRAARIIFTDKSITLTGLKAARVLQIYDVVRVTYPRRNLVDAIMEVSELTRHIDRTDLTLHGGSAILYAAIYANEPGVLPIGGTTTPIVDYTRTVPDPATGLAIVSEGYGRNAAGQDVAAIRFSATIPTVNCSGYQPVWKLSADVDWTYGGIINETGAVTFRIAPLITGAVYDFGVKTINAAATLTTFPSTAGDRLLNHQAAIDPTAPAAPTGLVATVGTGAAISLDWADNVESDLDEYMVFANSADSGWPTVTAGVISSLALLIAKTGKASRFNDIGSAASPLVIGAAKFYRILAEDQSSNASALTATVSETPTGAASGPTPATPAAPTLSSQGTYQGTITPANADGTTFVYAVVTVAALGADTAYMETGARTFGAAEYTSVGQSYTGGGTQRVEPGLPGWKYEIAQRAVGAFGMASAWSTALVFLAPGDLTAPALPTSIAVQNQNGKNITFSFVPPTVPDFSETDYQIRSASSVAHAAGAGSLIQAGKIGAKASDKTLNLEALTYATAYHVRLRSKDYTGNPTLPDTAGFSSGCTNNSPTVTGIAGIPIGTVVTGADLIAGTTIIAIPTPTSITLSNNWTGTTATHTLTYSALWSATIPFTLVRIDASANVGAGTVGGTEITTGAGGVGTPNIVDNAATGHAAVSLGSGYFNSTTTFTDICSVGLTTIGKRVTLEVSGNFLISQTSGTAQKCTMAYRLLRDGATLQTLGWAFPLGALGAGAGADSVIVAVPFSYTDPAPSAAAHTYKLQAAAVTANTTVTGSVFMLAATEDKR